MEYREFQFTEDGERHFTLSEDSISITGAGLNVHLLLRDLQPDYQTVRRRSSAYDVGLVACFLGHFGAAAFFINQELTDLFTLAIIVGVMAYSYCLFRGRRSTTRSFCARRATGDSLSHARGLIARVSTYFIDELSRRIRQMQNEGGLASL